MHTKQPKSKQLHISISERDLTLIDHKARSAAMTRSEYVRQTALGYPIEIPPIPTEFLHSLCSISSILTQNKSLDMKNTRLIKQEVDKLWQSLNS